MIDWLLTKICGETLPSDDVIAWLFQTFAWLIRYERNVNAFLQNRPLMLPSVENFPIQQSDGDALAQEVFELVRRHMRVEHMKAKLVPQPEDARERMLSVLAGSVSSALGTYRLLDDGTALITYAPKLLGDVPAFIATMAHELSHYYIRTGPGEPPGGPDAEEHATDAAVVFLGFGIYKVNSIFKTERSYEGTSWSSKGYLGELASAYALAMFSELHRLEPAPIIALLRPNVAGYLKTALRDLKRRERWKFELDGLRRL